MPKRSNNFQRLVYLVQVNLAAGATVTESKMLRDRLTERSEKWTFASRASSPSELGVGQRRRRVSSRRKSFAVYAQRHLVLDCS